jgi:NAD(P)-dependent dehydrogenase (short-subunit alcohol dehydrogenase family)
VASGSLAAYRRVDVTGPEDLRALVDLATQRFGHLDVVRRAVARRGR